MSAEPGPEWSVEYSQGWDDCLEAIHKVLGERFPLAYWNRRNGRNLHRR